MFLSGQSERWSLNMLVSVESPVFYAELGLTCSIVINQMDTSQAHLSSRPTTAPNKDNLSKEELTALLKYGAQKMCVQLLQPFNNRLMISITGSIRMTKFRAKN